MPTPIHTLPKHRVVVTGMGLVSCLGMDVDHFYQQLLSGKSGVRPITAFPCDSFPTRFAASLQGFDATGYVDKKQIRRADPCICYTMVAGKKAAQQSQLTPETITNLDKTRCGIIIGSGMGGMRAFSSGVDTVAKKGIHSLTPFFTPYIITNMGGALLAIDLDFRGPNYSISTACATANYCLFAAAQHIQRGDADVILAGGTEATILPMALGGFCALRALSEKNEAYESASRPWDKGRDGFVLGEGSGVLVLEELEHAKRRGASIFAEYLGGAISVDAHHMTQPEQEGRGVAQAMKKALEDGGVAREEVNYINAHATSTLAGDLCEIQAIKTVFGSHAKRIKINATKSMIGHGLGAAAGLEAIAVIKAIETGILHPTINLEEPEEAIQELDIVKEKAQKHHIRVAASNSFGFGGHNSVLLFAPYHP